MTFVFGLVVLCLLSSSAYGSENVANGQSGFTETQRQIILDKHNEYRNMEKATDMQTMTYDMSLEEEAQQAAAQCRFAHTQSSNGENIWAGTIASFGAADPITTWWSEIKDYDYASNSCAEGKMCGHYTQIVWANTNKVGCGVQFCDQGIIGAFGGKPGWIVFCQYSPPGNYRGQKPYTCSDASCAAPATAAPKPVTVTMPEDYCQATYGSSWCHPPTCQWTYCLESGTCMGRPTPDGIPCDVGKVCIDGSCQDDPTDETNSLTSGCLFGNVPRWAHICENPMYRICSYPSWTQQCCGTCAN